MKPKKKRELFVIAGLLYGLAMWFWTVLSLGAGHGTSVLFVIFSSPFGFFDFFSALSMVPVIWTIFGLLTAFIDYAVAKFIFLLSIAAHYIAMFFLLITLPYEVWKDFFRYLDDINGASVIVIGLVAYFVGQIVIWHRFIRSFWAG